MLIRETEIMKTRLWSVSILFWLAIPAVAQSDVMRVHFIDAGQGDAALIEFPCGTMLIDTGGEATTWKSGKLTKVFGGSNAVVGYLQGFFSSRPDRSLDLLILTHPHIDHTDGVPEVLRQFKPKKVVYNGATDGSGFKEQGKAKDYVKNETGVEGWYVLERKIPDGEGLTNGVIDPFDCGTVNPEVRILWGTADNDADWHPKEYGNGNNHSLVVRIQYGDQSILFTGDLEESEEGKTAGIERLVEKYKGTDLLDVDIYQVGHHGSANGTTDALVQAMSPKIAILSHGPACEVRKGFSAWRHGHPRKATIEELRRCRDEDGQPCLGNRPAKGVQVFEVPKKPQSIVMKDAIYSTGWDGTIILETAPQGDWSVVWLTGPDACVFDL
jgi:competence protein ComEC